MRYRLMATYRGVPYEVGVGPTNAEIVLFAACPPPEELGFEPATGHWRKPVIRAEIDALWESRPVGIFRGEPCMVLDDPGERLHIAYLGTDADRAANLGYWQVDRGVFELLTPREEVSGLTEERMEIPLHWGERPDETGPMATYPYGRAPWPVAAPTPARQPPPDGVSPAEALPAEAPPAQAPPAQTAQMEATPAQAAPVADAPMAGAPPASAPPANVPPGTVTPPPATAAPLAAPVLAGDDAQPPADTWPTDAGAGTGPRRGHAPAVDAPSFPAAAGSRSPTAPPGMPGPASAVPAPAADAQPPAPPGMPGPASAGPPEAAPAADSQPLTVPPGFLHSASAVPAPAPAGDIGGRAARRQRVPTREIFCELADLASIPRAAYALETETDGAMCLLAAPDGFEVFIAAEGARQEVRSFAEEEAAYFYLFGVLAAEAVRSGALAPTVAAANPYGGTV